jgi:hypothetical protein
MKSSDIPALRLNNQRLTRPGFERPEQAVSWMGAVQAQDYAAAKWAVGLRAPSQAEADIEQAFNQGTILRTHVMRPTWHFVMPADLLWMLELTAPRVHALMAYNNRNLGLDAAVFKRSLNVLRKALQGGGHLQRDDLAAALEKSGVKTDGLRLGHILMHAELEGLICSGPRQGKQFTYALLEERAPGVKTLGREEALAELTRRYFTGHGPATLRDFSWWSGLTMADAKRGIEMAGSRFVDETLGGQTFYWSSDSVTPGAKPGKPAYLLPNFDEYVVGYTERSAFFDPVHDEGQIPRNSMLSHHAILIDGRVAGTWKRTLSRDSVLVELRPFDALTKTQSRAVHAAAGRYAAFLGLSLVLT